MFQDSETGPCPFRAIELIPGDQFYEAKMFVITALLIPASLPYHWLSRRNRRESKLVPLRQVQVDDHFWAPNSASTTSERFPIPGNTSTTPSAPYERLPVRKLPTRIVMVPGSQRPTSTSSWKPSPTH